MFSHFNRNEKRDRDISGKWALNLTPNFTERREGMTKGRISKDESEEGMARKVRTER